MRKASREMTIELFKDWQKNIFPTYDRAFIEGTTEILSGANKLQIAMFISYLETTVSVFENIEKVQHCEDTINYIISQMRRE